MNDPGRPSVAAGRLLGGRYEIEGWLGSGGMAAVWRGRDLRLGRQVAVKELSGEGLRQPQALERFAREARAVGRLSHSNVVSVFDVGIQDGHPYLVMELVEGPTLATLLAGGPLPVADALAIGSQVCDGLAAAHEAGIIHRDIKPANLIVTPGGVVKICDFGIARLLDPAGDANLTGATVWGSLSYMAPEQIDTRPVDARTDLYALGCAMYAMLAGAPPFTDGGLLGIVQQHLTEPPEPLRSRRPEVPSQVEALVTDLLAKDPDNRPADAAAVRARIAAALDDPAIAASPRGLMLRPAAVPFAVTAATTTPDQDLPRAGRDTRSARVTKRRVSMIAALLCAAALGTAAALMVRPVTHDDAAGPVGPTTSAAARPPAVTTSSSPQTRSEEPQAKPVPTRSALPTTPSTPAPSSPPTDPIVALRQTIGQQVTTGNLEPNAAPDLNHMVDDLAHTISTGNTTDVQNKVTALQTKLTALNKAGQLSNAGYNVLSDAVDQVATANPG